MLVAPYREELMNPYESPATDQEPLERLDYPWYVTWAVNIAVVVVLIAVILALVFPAV